MDKNIFRDGMDYWLVAENIRDLYLSEGSISTLIDFERVLDELDLYAFKNWMLGELVSGPKIDRYKTTCIFMWPYEMMPDPRGARRLLPFDCTVKYKKTRIKIPIKIEDPDDFIPGTHKARLITKPIWLVEIAMPKSLMADIRTGSVEMEGQDIDLAELDDAYDNDLDKEEYVNDEQNQETAQPAPAQPAPAL